MSKDREERTDSLSDSERIIAVVAEHDGPAARLFMQLHKDASARQGDLDANQLFFASLLNADVILTDVTQGHSSRPAHRMSAYVRSIRVVQTDHSVGWDAKASVS